jgi:ribosome assembly protein 4
MQTDGDCGNSSAEVKRVLSRFKSDAGDVLPGGLLDLPVNITVDKLQLIVNALLGQDDPVPLAFFIDDVQIEASLEDNIKDFNTSENVIEIVYQPQAIFQVRAVTRCTGTLEGMILAVLL